MSAREASASVDAAHAPQRILVVGSATFDGVSDSYCRALSPYYNVRQFDPFFVVGGRGHRAGRFAARANAAIQYLSRGVFREPLALVEPRLLRAAQEFCPDIVIVTAIESLRPHVVTGLRGGNARCKVIGVFSDHIANFARGYFFGSDYDGLFFKDKYIVDKFRRKLAWTHVHYLPQACDRLLHRKLPLSAEDHATFGCDLTLAGNVHMYRAEMLRPLVGRDLKIWGIPPRGWIDHPIVAHCTGRYVAGDDKCKAMLASKIVVNQNHYAEINGTNKRTFEMAAIGAFQVTDTPAIADVFDSGSEVATFDTLNEMLERIDYFLAHPEARAAMAERARLRAHAQHTYEHRWVAHLRVLGATPPADFPVQPDSNVVWAS